LGGGRVWWCCWRWCESRRGCWWWGWFGSSPGGRPGGPSHGCAGGVGPGGRCRGRGSRWWGVGVGVGCGVVLLGVCMWFGCGFFVGGVCGCCGGGWWGCCVFVLVCCLVCVVGVGCVVCGVVVVWFGVFLVVCLWVFLGGWCVWCWCFCGFFLFVFCLLCFFVCVVFFLGLLCCFFLTGRSWCCFRSRDCGGVGGGCVKGVMRGGPKLRIWDGCVVHVDHSGETGGAGWGWGHGHGEKVAGGVRWFNRPAGFCWPMVGLAVWLAARNRGERRETKGGRGWWVTVGAMVAHCIRSVVGCRGGRSQEPCRRIGGDGEVGVGRVARSKGAGLGGGFVRAGLRRSAVWDMLWLVFVGVWGFGEWGGFVGQDWLVCGGGGRRRGLTSVVTGWDDLGCRPAAFGCGWGG